MAKANERANPINLSGLSFEQAIDGLLKVGPVKAAAKTTMKSRKTKAATKKKPGQK